MVRAVFLLFVVLLAGCDDPVGKSAPSSAAQSASPEAAENAHGALAIVSDSPLAGTEWRLVEFQSMDDAVGTTRPNDPSRYTMRLNGDGTVNMRLNCNTAKGTWSAEAGPDPSSGRFEFGPLASPRALCPPPSMDEQISAQAQYVRSYMLKDRRLYLSLMADGGIYVWDPSAEGHFLMKPDADIEAAILRASPYYTRKSVDAGGTNGKGRYVYDRVDLNGDGKDEVFVYLLGPFFCGTGGCNLMLFTKTQDGYSLINDFPISRLPVIVSAKQNGGWNDIIRLESGGGAPPTYVTHIFDGMHYVERDRIPADAAPEGTPYLTGELTFYKGIPLEPQN
ncbi:MAG: META domain-containing protein [Thermodesulfobacteriota bacterium]